MGVCGNGAVRIEDNPGPGALHCSCLSICWRQGGQALDGHDGNPQLFVQEDTFRRAERQGWEDQKGQEDQ